VGGHTQLTVMFGGLGFGFGVWVWGGCIWFGSVWCERGCERSSTCIASPTPHNPPHPTKAQTPHPARARTGWGHSAGLVIRPAARGGRRAGLDRARTPAQPPRRSGTGACTGVGVLVGLVGLGYSRWDASCIHVKKQQSKAQLGTNAHRYTQPNPADPAIQRRAHL